VQPVLAATSLRVDTAGVPALDGLSFATTGERVLLLGAARAFFEAAAGLRAVTRGELRVEGTAPIDAVRSGLAACAPLDPPLPPRWTVAQYATWSARLAGHARAAAASLAAEALERMSLGDARVAKTKLGAASLAVRRGTVVAAALATGAKTLLLEDPAPGLDDQAARTLARVLARALADRRSALFSARVSLDSPVALAADEALVVDGSRVVAQGAPAEIAAAERTLVLRVYGNAVAFAREVERLGGHADVTTGAPQPAHVHVRLGPLATRDVLRIAAETQAVVIELRPLARAFA
jgi:ABC-type multidrug transport system ATPase subunit